MAPDAREAIGPARLQNDVLIALSAFPEAVRREQPAQAERARPQTKIDSARAANIAISRDESTP